MAASLDQVPRCGRLATRLGLHQNPLVLPLWDTPSSSDQWRQISPRAPSSALVAAGENEFGLSLACLLLSVFILLSFTSSPSSSLLVLQTLVLRPLIEPDVSSHSFVISTTSPVALVLRYELRKNVPNQRFNRHIHHIFLRFGRCGVSDCGRFAFRCIF